MNFDNKEISHWKNNYSLESYIEIDVYRGNDWGMEAKHETVRFKTEQKLNKWLNEYNLGSYDFIEHIREIKEYELDYDKEEE